MPRTATVFRFIFSLLRTRAARAVLWVLFFFWLFDRLVYFATETQWFASLNLSPLWWARCRAQCELFCGLTFLALLLARLFLSPVGRLPLTSLPLRGKLAIFESLRGDVFRFSSTVALVVALLEAVRFTRHWPEWLLLRSGAPLDFSYLGLPGSLWMQWLPVITPLLRALWAFSWLLLFLTALTGVLRALPELAARRPASPLVFTRSLWILGAWLLGLRAMMHVTGLFDLARGRALESGDVYVGAPLFVAGAIFCALLAGAALRRAATPTTRRRFSGLAITVAAAIWLPGILNWLTIPGRSLLPETRWLKRARLQATSVAWQLDFAAAGATPAGIEPEKAWPVWDEKVLLPPAGFRDRNFVVWKSATISGSSQGWRAVIAGQSAGTTAWNANRETSDSTRLTVKQFNLLPSGEMKALPRQGAEAYFGFEGSSLFTNENFGVPIASFVRQCLWAWRLRDLFLIFDGAENSHLLVFRGALERAERIAPFWKVADSPQLVLKGNQPYWLIDVCTVSPHFPGAMPARQGQLARQNAASDSIKMLLDARTGAVSFFALAPHQTDPLQAVWRAAFPGVLRDASRLPQELQEQWRAAPSMLSAQLDMFDASRGLQTPKGQRRTVEAQPGSDGRRNLTRALSLYDNEFESLEAMQGVQRERVLRKGESNLLARLAAIETAMAKVTEPKGSSIMAGDPFVWPDADSPGGFRLGRAFFAMPLQKTLGEAQAPAVSLWRVALTGTAKNAPVRLSESVRPTTSGAALASKPGSAVVRKNEPPTAAAALRAHDAAQAAVRRSDFTTFGRESKREREILEQMVAQSKAR